MDAFASRPGLAFSSTSSRQPTLRVRADLNAVQTPRLERLAVSDDLQSR
jgi:hypothetical protein